MFEIPSQHRRRRTRDDMTPPRTSRVVGTPPNRGRPVDRPQTPQRRRGDTSAPPIVMTTSTTTTTTTDDEATITIHDGNSRGSAPGAKSPASFVPAGEWLPPAVLDGALELRKTGLVEHSSLEAPVPPGSNCGAEPCGMLIPGILCFDPCRVLHGANHSPSEESYAEFPNPFKSANSGNFSGGSMEVARRIDVAVQT